MVTNQIDDIINTYNSRLSKTYADFANALEEIRRIMPAEENYLFDEHQARIDNAYQSLITISRPHIRRFAEEASKPENTTPVTFGPIPAKRFRHLRARPGDPETQASLLFLEKTVTGSFFLRQSGGLKKKGNKTVTKPFWHPMTEQPTEPERWNTFVIAYRNPRFYRSKFAEEPENNGIPPYVFDVAVWTGSCFAHTKEIKYWARIPTPAYVF